MVNNIYRLKLKAPKLYKKIKPGQFVHLKLNPDKNDPLLRRPFSVFDVDHKNKSIIILYRIVGRGTKYLSTLKLNTRINLLGPLGQGFSLDLAIEQNNILILGGGMGIAPLYFLTKKISSMKDTKNINVLLGTESKDEMNLFHEYFSQLNILLESTTKDGKQGFKGNVVDLWFNLIKNKSLPNTDYIFTCGPEKMLLSIQKKALEKDMQGELSLERRMGCGIGVCLSCVCDTRDGHKKTCKEGPVFPLNEVIINE